MMMATVVMMAMMVRMLELSNATVIDKPRVPGSRTETASSHKCNYTLHSAV